MWKIINFNNQKNQKALSLPQIIRSNRRSRRWLLSITIITMISTSLLYLQTIWPIFIKPDLTNPAIQDFVTSDSFNLNTNQFFEALRRYNNRKKGEDISAPNGFIAGSGSQLGVAVNASYKLVPRDNVDVTTSSLLTSSGLRQYTYVPEFTIVLDQRYLIMYIIAIVFLLTLSLHTVFEIIEERKEEDRLLSEYSSLTKDVSRTLYMPDPVDELADLLSRFHVFAKQIGIRHGPRKSITFNDEYDVQDALHALLRLHYLDVRDEEYTPSYAGKSSRIDFLVNDEKIGIEVKMARENLADKEIGDQLLIDIGRYQEHEKCKALICFVYDPKGLLSRPHGLIVDLEKRSQGSGMKVKVVVSPLH